ncbi:MAG TPA: GNAT family N-acetyltransferase [Stellaceae bacterium]|jgi:predicted N-acyltransferase|nr:GNAT family N-acetyltransferase [Stellaceae bacterium]
MDTGEQVALTVHPSIAEIPAAEWDACAGDINPTLSYTFLQAMEESGSATARSGWAAQHLSLADPSGRVIGIVPLYLKSHSYGEYVFDYGWADAYERAGGQYYPKALSGVPFTPVPGPRLLVAPDAPPDTKAVLVAGLVEFTRQRGISSLHINFPEDTDAETLFQAGFLKRMGQQFHWTNDGYKTFADYLAALNSRKRKAVNKERREALAPGLEIDVLTGADLQPKHWDAFYRFYLATSDRKWGSAYLNRKFFALINERMADKIVLVMARNAKEYVAGAFNILGTETIYGRNWGSYGDYKMLHFECCYYRAIEFAIDHGLKRVEAGAQGPHKLQRGYLPVPTYSAHYIPDPNFRRAVAQFLAREREMVEHKIEQLGEYSPFRHTDGEAAED